MTDLEHEMRQQLRAEGWRFCHNRSARKHRKQGHTVHYYGGGEYRWKATTQHPEGGDGR